MDREAAPGLDARAGAANQLGMCWKPAAIAARPAMQSANRIRTLWITPLSYERAAPKDGAAETVTAGTARAAVVRDDGRRSGDRRARTVSTIRDEYGAGNPTAGEKR
ncbi:hypothetical protein [Burkholderia ambifaria]|uniref:hypothetical protein n=1 Tax=Burkholderia ambifaria TaxID=152480 RepID=UPI00158A3F10|nr:hypothetical protein [Burkholderia ambifaria]